MEKVPGGRAKVFASVLIRAAFAAPSAGGALTATFK